MQIKKFEEIEAWKESRRLVNKAYDLTSTDLFKKDFGLKEQLQRTSVSCMSNIAEGFDSGSAQHFIQYLLYSRRSSSEVQSIAYVALDRKYIRQNEFQDIYDSSMMVGKLVNGFIRYLNKANNRQIGKSTNRQTGKPVNRQTNNAFTLVELMLVVIIIGVLAAMVMPRLVGRSEQARVSAAKADVNANISLALDMFEMDMGHYPNSIDELMQKGANPDSWKGPYLKRKPVDPWGRPYEYKPGADGRDYQLCSKGPDEAKADDDICNAAQEK